VVAAEKAQKGYIQIKTAKKGYRSKNCWKAAIAVAATGDSTQSSIAKTLGNFAYSATFCKAGMTTIENELVKLTIANKGGYIVEAT
jgi:YidC/Oxa1 family membrane protein insertase